MKNIDPFDIDIFGKTYAVFPEEDGTYAIFKDGKEYLIIQKDEGTQWIKLDPKTGLPLFGLDEEVNLLGQEITRVRGDK